MVHETPSAATPTARTIDRVQRGEVVNRGEMTNAFLPVLREEFPASDLAWGALLGALHARGPAPQEVLGLVDAVLTFDTELDAQLTHKRDLSSAGTIVTITGSGKETFKTFNVSTCAALIASCHPDVCVIKPAGSATSATTGASEVLEAAGVRFPRTLDKVITTAERIGFCVFDYHLVAPRYGPRYEGRFHHLHPLSHVTPWLFLPFGLDGIVFGVADPNTWLAASIMDSLKVPRASVVSTDLGTHGRIDEAAPFGRNTISMLEDGHIKTDVADLPIPSALEEIRQRSSHQENSTLLRDILAGDAPQLARDLVGTNAGEVLRVAGVVDSHEHGVLLAEEYIDRGDALRKLDACVEATRHA